jgi:hypothetical protein
MGPYQFVAQLNFVRESWTAPVDALRVHPTEDANTVAAGQVKGLLGRSAMEDGVPLFVFDAGRLRSRQGAARARGRSRADPRPFAGRPLLPRRSEPLRAARLHRPAASARSEDEVRGSEHLARAFRRTRVRGCWLRDGARQSLGELAPEGPGARRTRKPRAFANRSRDAGVSGGREAAPRREAARASCAVAVVAWPRRRAPDLGLLWRAYARRFDLEHTFRLLKQTLGWSAPRVRHPEQADRWTWLVLAAFTQLRLARASVADLRLPWERRYDTGRLTPIRVHRVVSGLLGELGTPAKPPKPCGRSPGRPKGRLSGRAKRYPALKKSA